MNVPVVPAPEATTDARRFPLGRAGLVRRVVAMVGTAALLVVTVGVVGGAAAAAPVGVPTGTVGTPTQWGNAVGPVPSEAVENSIAIASGLQHELALLSDGTVTAWGDNYSGHATVPAGLTGVTAIAAGWGHFLALKKDGTVTAWGYNYSGQATVPAGLTGVTAIAAGTFHSFALKSDGTVTAWGDNYYGQSTVPAGLTGVTAIAAGTFHSVALKSDGTVTAWGDYSNGRTTVPAGLAGVTAIAAGNAHSLALKSDGTIIAWGSNDYKQATVPTGLTGVTAIAAGYNHSLALKSDGTITAWGNNADGQTTVPTVPTGVTAIAAGGNHSLALVENTATAPVFTNDTPPATVTAGTLFSYQFTATGYPAPTFTVTAGTLPTGLTLSAAGLLEGTLPAGPSSAFTVTASNGIAPDAVGASHTITATAAPVFTNDTPPATVTAGTAFSYQFTATGHPAPTFAVTAGTLPAGLTLSAAGLLEGTPTGAGEYQARITASNGSHTSAVTMRMTVGVAPEIPAGPSERPPAATAGSAYAFTVPATGTGPFTFAVTSGSLPDGLTLNPNTGVISGTPTTTSGSTFTVTVTTPFGTTATEYSITLTPAPGPAAPASPAAVPQAIAQLAATGPAGLWGTVTAAAFALALGATMITARRRRTN